MSGSRTKQLQRELRERIGDRPLLQGEFRFYKKQYKSSRPTVGCPKVRPLFRKKTRSLINGR